MAGPDALHFTGDAESDALIAREPLALLIGFALDQQITVQTAFAGPLKLQQRLGSLDAATIAATDPAELEALFRRPPAIHRFPGSMAKRVQDLCQHVATEYDGHAERVWTEAGGREGARAPHPRAPGLRRHEGQGPRCRARQAIRRRGRRAARPELSRPLGTSTRPRRSRRTRPQSAPTRRPVESKVKRRLKPEGSASERVRGASAARASRGAAMRCARRPDPR